MCATASRAAAFAACRSACSAGFLGFELGRKSCAEGNMRGTAGEVPRGYACARSGGRGRAEGLCYAPTQLGSTNRNPDRGGVGLTCPAVSQMARFTVVSPSDRRFARNEACIPHTPCASGSRHIVGGQVGWEGRGAGEAGAGAGTRRCCGGSYLNCGLLLFREDVVDVAQHQRRLPHTSCGVPPASMPRSLAPPHAVRLIAKRHPWAAR